MRCQACDGGSASNTGGMPCKRFGAMHVMAHRDVGEDAFRTIPVLVDEVGGKPDAGFLFNWVHGYRVRGVDFVQYTAKVSGESGWQAWSA